MSWPQRLRTRARTSLPVAVSAVMIAAGLTAVLEPAHAAETPPTPTVELTPPTVRPYQDPFYTYSDATPLAARAPGAVLKARSVLVGLGGAPAVLPATQLLYRTVDEQKNPAVTVTTVIAPTGGIPTGGAPLGIVSYESFYDALGDLCSPSYTLRGGDPGASNASLAQKESALITALAAQGYAVTIPDFEGTKLHWVAGHESGWSSLDSIRATETFLNVPATTKVGLFGYSGGSIGGEWAAELAPSYAPELNIVAAALGGIPVHLAHNLNYVNGSPTWSGVIPAATVALSRAFGADMAQYESDYGKKVSAEVSDKCIGAFNADYPGLKVADMMKPQYADFLGIPVVASIVNSLIMGSTAGHPVIQGDVNKPMPMMMLVGNHDGTGDDVMIVKDVAALAKQYCDEGVPVKFTESAGDDHTNAGIKFFASGMTWLLGQMGAGIPDENCASIPAGNSLAPVTPSAQPAPAKRAVHPRLKGRNRGRIDVLRVNVDAPRGTVVRFYRARAGHYRYLGKGVVNAHGQVVRRQRDRNGHKVAWYRVVVLPSATTLRGTSNPVRVR